MTRGTFDRQVLFDVSWWHWSVTIPFLVANLAGVTWAGFVVVGLCLLAGGYFWSHLRQIRPFPVQVRVAYVIWFLLGGLPYMQWMLWVQLAGTTAMVTVGYCPLIRLLCLLSYNRQEALSFHYIWRVFFRDPCAGGLVKWYTNQPHGPATSCALPSLNNGMSCSLPQTTNYPQKENHHAAPH